MRRWRCRFTGMAAAPRAGPRAEEPTCPRSPALLGDLLVLNGRGRQAVGPLERPAHATRSVLEGVAGARWPDPGGTEPLEVPDRVGDPGQHDHRVRPARAAGVVAAPDPDHPATGAPVGRDQHPGELWRAGGRDRQCRRGGTVAGERERAVDAVGTSRDRFVGANARRRRPCDRYPDGRMRTVGVAGPAEGRRSHRQHDDPQHGGRTSPDVFALGARQRLALDFARALHLEPAWHLAGATAHAPSISPWRSSGSATGCNWPRRSSSSAGV